MHSGQSDLIFFIALSCLRPFFRFRPVTRTPPGGWPAMFGPLLADHQHIFPRVTTAIRHLGPPFLLRGALLSRARLDFRSVLRYQPIMWAEPS